MGSFYRCLVYFLGGGDYVSCPHFPGCLQAKCQVYSLAVVFFLWDQPHYRNGTFQQDMVKNLRNVAVPGTGLALSYFCHFKWTAYYFLFVLYPLAALFSALYHAPRTGRTLSACFHEQLLTPQDWFSFWRMNCRLASYHSLLMGDQAKGYALEDKWLFLLQASSRGIPVSPWIDLPRLVVKDKNEEGGMGIKFYKNAVAGGDWIIQEALDNADCIARLLPPNPPLSTLRVITASTYGVPTAEGRLQSGPPGDQHVRSLSCVFRAGRAGAATDHSSILFDVDLQTGTLLKGTTNAHWYQLGPTKAFSTPWTSSHTLTHHPDCGVKITGETIPDIIKIRQLVEEAHKELIPDVPLAGWDVALTTKGTLLLEVNLSCNFFRGTFDVPGYVVMLDAYFSKLDGMMKERNRAKKFKKL
uniref:Alpha-L-glutamate ligase-related protein ATP-grasp domain-containing protein n=1 Tax=Arcella intermedia TaxID=1963864 RepID=A0A6B2L540_9EUKA